MASIGPSYFTTAFTQTTYSGSTVWANPANARVNDGSYATQSNPGTSTATQNINIKLSDLGVPANTTITGVVFTMRVRQSTTNSDFAGEFCDGGLSTTTYYGTPPAKQWAGAVNTWTTLTFGSTTNTWGLAAAQLQSSWWNGSTGYFQFWSQDYTGSGDICDVDWVQMTVYYTGGAVTNAFTCTVMNSRQLLGCGI